MGEESTKVVKSDIRVLSKMIIPVGTFTYYFEREGGKMSEISYRGTTGVGYAKLYHRSGSLQAEGLIYNAQVKTVLGLIILEVEF